MLTHTSGLPDFYSLPEYPIRKYQKVTLTDLVAWVKTRPLDFLSRQQEQLQQYRLRVSGLHH